ncbi:Retrovirus-related Pol polyprotein from transposon 17.6, partial [Mucuna pruriens]
MKSVQFDNLRLENQLIEFTSLVRQLAVEQHQPSIAARVCGISTSNKQSGVPEKYELQQQEILSSNLPSQTIPNPRGNASVVTLRSGRELPQPAPQLESRPTDVDSKPDANSQVPQQDRSIPLSFPTEPFRQRSLNAIKSILKYAKFLKELCVHKRKKMKREVESGGIVLALTQNDEFTTGVQQALPKKCRDPRIFSVPCTIGDCTFVDAMLDLGASINVMPTSIYKSLKFGDLEPTGMTIQLANRNVLVQVNELIFPADFYVLDMEDETSRKGSTLILGRPFLMTTRTKINVHAETLSMEYGDHLVQFNIFEAMKYLIEDHSLFGIDLIDELVEEHLQLNASIDGTLDFEVDTDIFNCLGSVTAEADYNELREECDLSNSEDGIIDLADLGPEEEFLDLLNQSEEAEIMLAYLVPKPDQVGQSDPKATNDTSSSLPPPIELNPLLSHLKYAYLDTKQQLLVIIANNLHQEQHKKEIGWKLFDLPSINPSICIHRILMEKEARPIRQQQRRLNPTTLDMIKKEVTKLLAVGIIYPISDSQWVSLVQVVPKKSGMTVMKNQHDELNSWRVYIDYRRLNQATCKDHFLFSFIDQVLEKLIGKSHYCFLDGFSRYMQIHIAPEDQHKTTFTCPFGTFAHSRMSFVLCNAPSTFQRCMISIFTNLLQDCMEVFMDDFTVYVDSFDACLRNLSKVLARCINTNLVLNFEKCHFMVIEGIVLGHLVSNRGIEVDKSKIDIITSLSNPTSVQEVRSFLGHAGFYKRFIKNFSKIALPLSKLLQKDVDFKFDHALKPSKS